MKKFKETNDTPSSPVAPRTCSRDSRGEPGGDDEGLVVGEATGEARSSGARAPLDSSSICAEAAVSRGVKLARTADEGY